MTRIRVQRIEKELLRIISNTINFKLRDKYLKFITITRIRISNDLSNVRVYYTHMEDSDRENVQEALTKSTGFIKRELASAKFLRIIPEILFHYDTIEQESRKLDKIFDIIKAEKEKN